MANLFDGLQTQAFDIVTKTMGYDAVWRTFTGQVLFNEPTQLVALGGLRTSNDIADYLSRSYNMEYRDGLFPGLKDAVDASKAIMEVITINALQYYIRAVEQKFDGKNYVATLERKYD